MFSKGVCMVEKKRIVNMAAVFAAFGVFIMATFAFGDDSALFEEMRAVFQSMETAKPEKDTLMQKIESASKQEVTADVISNDGLKTSASLSAATAAYPGEPRVSVTTYGRRLGDILLGLGSEYGYTVVPGPGVDFNHMIAIDMRDVPLSQVLDAITTNVNYGYELQGTKITVFKHITKSIHLPEAAVNMPVMTTDMGGDFLGGSNGGGMKSSVTIKHQSYAKDPRQALEENIRKLMTAEGNMVVDWLSSSVMVTDSPRNISIIEKYIANLQASSDKQVKVEALIAQVSTKNGNGIDWWRLAGRLGSESSNIRFHSVSSAIASMGDGMNMVRANADIPSVAKALEEQGNMQVLAKPFIYARNMHPVAIWSAKNIPVAGGTRTISDGIALPVRCTVRGDGKIDVQIAPVITSIEDVSTLASAVQQTMQSVTVNDGDTIVLGGIQREKFEKVKKASPLSKIPIIGWIFNTETEEMVPADVVIAIKVKRTDVGVTTSAHNYTPSVRVQ